ncbi:MAG: serine hydrolase domain-containing protein, partial [Acidimicrobiales bacterium]
SNLGYAILGQIVRQTTGETCEALIGKRFVEPLNLLRTSWQSVPPAAAGYRVDPYQDVLRDEPDMQQRAAGMGGQMWSTTNDLTEWAQALMGLRPSVLDPAVVEQMHVVRVLVDPERWSRGWGFGLAHMRTDDRIWSGHTGAVPGFAAALTFDRQTGVAVAILTNTMDAVGLDALALDLAERAVPIAAAKQDLEPWHPGQPCPAEFEELLGSWWFEGGETVFFWRDGCLQAEIRGRPGSGSKLTQTAPDRYRTTEGRERGELLVVHRDDGGRAEWLEWATYPYVRRPTR